MPKRVPKICYLIFFLLVALIMVGQAPWGHRFDPNKDILSLHYDHAPDRDDGHSAAADRTILESIFGPRWIAKHVLAVSGTYGENKDRFVPQSDKVMEAAWGDGCGWLSAHTQRKAALNQVVRRWTEVLRSGGDIWVKEGGQSDFTAAAVKQVRDLLPSTKLRSRIHVVQHSDWNEEHTTDDALRYTQQHTDYIRISDANAYLRSEEDLEDFVRRALLQPDVHKVWKSAFEYYDPLAQRLDFSDTGELMYILNLGKIDINQFKERFLTE